MPSQTWQETLVAQQADGPTLTAAAAASCIHSNAKITLPNNFWEIKRVVRILMTGRVSTVITTPGTFRFDVRMGNTVVFDSLAILPDTVQAHTNVGWWLDILLTCRSVGNGVLTTLFGQGKFICEDILGTPATPPKGVLTAMLPWNSPPAVGNGFDNTLANTLDVFFTQTVATGSLTVHQYLATAKN